MSGRPLLVTGGAGYIGSHAVRALRKAGYEPVVLDNFSRGHEEAVPTDIECIRGDIADGNVSEILTSRGITGIVHFAAHSQVGESMTNPAIYYENNVVGSFRLIESARAAGVKHFVFSSTAAVYGEPDTIPIYETAALEPTNVYGRTKLMIERMLSDYSEIYGLRYTALRYFNAAGADEGGDIGEDHTPETHLVPLVLEAASGKRDGVTVFGTDYPTPDGTCIRDYIHVTDLAEAHVKALGYLENGGDSVVLNLGTGRGLSVKEIIDAAGRVTGRAFPVHYGERRAGDPGVLVADASRARDLLGWTASRSDADTILADAWAWHRSHPDGY